MKEQKLNKPHRREILCRDRFSMQITSEVTDDTKRAQMTQMIQMNTDKLR
jgi:hypothetical protein